MAIMTAIIELVAVLYAQRQLGCTLRAWMAWVVFAVDGEARSTCFRNEGVVVVNDLNFVLVARHLQIPIGGPCSVAEIMPTACRHDTAEPEEGL